MPTCWSCQDAARPAVRRESRGADRARAGITRAAITVVAAMSKAVQFDSYGGIDVLEVRDVPKPVPGAGEVLVEVKAVGINPGEAMIRQGFLHDRWPATFPSGQGSDLRRRGRRNRSRALTASPRATRSSGSPIVEPVRPNSSSCQRISSRRNRPTSAGMRPGALFVAGTTAYARGSRRRAEAG